ncbi:MAG: hypothetical protein SGPRY_005295 [Prymnesium sp.]
MASSPDLLPSPRSEEKTLNPLARHARALRDSAILEEQTLSQLGLTFPPSNKIDDDPCCKRGSSENMRTPPLPTNSSAGASSHTFRAETTSVNSSCTPHSDLGSPPFLANKQASHAMLKHAFIPEARVLTAALASQVRTSEAPHSASTAEMASTCPSTPAPAEHPSADPSPAARQLSPHANDVACQTEEPTAMEALNDCLGSSSWREKLSAISVILPLLAFSGALVWLTEWLHLMMDEIVLVALSILVLVALSGANRG